MPFKKNVFILGAGASADAGAPLMHSFLRRARDLMDDQRSSLTGDERQSFQRVFQYLYELRRAQALVNVDLDNIEDLFGVIDLEARVEKEHADRTRDDLVRLIIKTLDLTIQPQRTYILNPRTGQDYGEPNLTVHGHFARIVLRTPLTDLDSRQALCPESDSVITFNYDTLIDASFRQMGAVPDYCLGNAVDRRQARTGRGIKLLKLHGSAGWTLCRRCEAARAGRVHVFDNYQDAQNQTCEDCHLNPMQPLIIPPTWDKGASRQYLAPVWQVAWRELSRAQRLFIIGYSAPRSDTHFRYLLASALAANSRLDEIIVVTNSEGAEVVKRTYGELFAGSAGSRRLDFEVGGFGGYVANAELFRAVGG